MMYAAGGEDFFKKATTYSEGVWDTAEAGKLFETVSKLAPYTEKTTVANANNDNYLKNQQLILDNKEMCIRDRPRPVYRSEPDRAAVEEGF